MLRSLRYGSRIKTTNNGGLIHCSDIRKRADFMRSTDGVPSYLSPRIEVSVIYFIVAHSYPKNTSLTFDSVGKSGTPSRSLHFHYFLPGAKKNAICSCSLPVFVTECSTPLGIHKPTPGSMGVSFLSSPYQTVPFPEMQ